MITTSKQISTHFHSSEFVCQHCGQIKIDENLVNKMEHIFSKLNASKCIISSGYRCPTYDIQIGGFAGRHSEGLAADCIYYDNNGKIIPSKIVICVAYDLGELNGIAKINDNYTHLDNRVGSTYRGDETRGNSSYWTNPYTYFNVSKADVAKYTGENIQPFEVIYQTWDDVKNTWLPNVVNANDYAGIFSHDVCAIYANANTGFIYYKVHIKGKNWLPEVENRSDYAGLYNQPIDGFMIKSDTKQLKYRVHLRRSQRWLSWVTGYSETDHINGFAGILGQEIDAIQIDVV